VADIIIQALLTVAILLAGLLGIGG
jgi:hypothetical protein